MRIRGTLAVLEVLAFIVGLTAWINWWNLPCRLPFWQTIGLVFMFIFIALAEVVVFLAILFGGRR